MTRLRAAYWTEYTGYYFAPWWSNFHSQLFFNSPEERTLKFAEWGAVWVEDIKEYYLEFENEADATLFLLRWS